MKQKILNELQNIIGRIPTTDEKDLCLDYVEEYFDHELGSVKDDDIKLAVAYFVDENMERCSQCGEYELCHNMIKSACNYFCSTTCEEAYYNDLTDTLHEQNQSFIYRF